MSDELSFGNGKKLSREDFRREINEGSLSKDARFKKILSAFDVNGNGQADDGEIDDLFGRMASYAGRDGNSVFDRREIEAFLEDTQVEGKSLQSIGMSANELMGFFKAEPTSGARETYTYNSETGELSEDEIKEETISFIDEEFKSGMAMLEMTSLAFCSSRGQTMSTSPVSTTMKLSSPRTTTSLSRSVVYTSVLLLSAQREGPASVTFPSGSSPRLDTKLNRDSQLPMSCQRNFEG